MKKILLLITLLSGPIIWAQQQNVPSIHEEQLNYYNSHGNTEASFYEQLPTEQVGFPKTGCNLNKVVYGWHPYWVGSAYQNYQWDLLSHFSFFSYEVNPNDGSAYTTHGWSTSAAVDAALASGNTKVTLCVTLFSGHSTFFASPVAQQNLISNLINLVQTRGADGVNIDFEGVSGSLSTDFANFMVDLANQMHTAIPGSEVSTVLYAVDWNNLFDFSIMEPAVDQYIIMGYGYYYTGSATAGPTDPLYHFGSTYNYTLSKTVTSYLNNGCPNDKLVLGLPYYGYEWETTSSNIPSSTVGAGSAKTFAAVMSNASGNYSVGNGVFQDDPVSQAFLFTDGAQKQCFISLDTSFRKRLDHVLKTGIAGIGIWALGYDNGYTELWSGIEDYLTDCYTDPCSGVIHDFGGPTRNYYDDEDYTWTIQPPGASSLDVDFTEFDVELNYDYLYIYDGDSDQSPQISGSPFTGINGPGQFTTSTGAVTFRFYSDGATVTPGFNATYTCNTVPSPIAVFSIDQTSVCVGDSVQLTNNSSDGDSFLWSTSSGGLSSTSAFEPYLYPVSSGNYTITLDVTNSTGSDQTTEQILITVEEAPVAIASSLDTLIEIPIEMAFFTNNSIYSTNYNWDFGDGAASTDFEPWHEYTSNGVYEVMLIADNDVCPADTTFITIYVGTQGLYENSESVELFPTLVSNELTVQLNVSDEAKLKVIDEKGSMVLETDQLHEGSNAVDLSKLSSGVYYAVVAIGEKAAVEKIIKQ